MKQKVKIEETTIKIKEIEISFPFYRYDDESWISGRHYFHKIISFDKGIYITITEDSFSDDGGKNDDCYEVEIVSDPLNWTSDNKINYGLNDSQEEYRYEYEKALEKISNVIQELK